MTKDERRLMIQELLNQGKTDAEIVAQVSGAANVSASTVRGDLKAVQGVGEGEQGDEQNQGEETGEGSDPNGAAAPSASPAAAQGQEQGSNAGDAGKGAQQPGQQKNEAGELVYINLVSDQERQNPNVIEGRVNAYTVQKGSEHLVHAEIEAVNFNPVTGYKVSTPRVQTFEPKTWEETRQALQAQGYSYVKVIHTGK